MGLMQQKNITVNEVDYTLQKVTPREWLRIRERSKNKHGLPVEENLYTEILEHIVVNPKLTIDSFEEVEDLEEVMKAAISFQCRKQQKESELL